MFQADAATMKISVNTAIEVVVGFENTSGNRPRIAIPIAISSTRARRRTVTRVESVWSLRPDRRLPEQAARSERENDDQ